MQISLPSVWLSNQELQKHTFTPMERRSGGIVPGWYIMYDLDECEKCNGECMAANAVNVMLGNNTEGLTIREALPCELGWSDAFGGAVCEHCSWGEKSTEEIKP